VETHTIGTDLLLRDRSKFREEIDREGIAKSPGNRHRPFPTCRT